jgi:predicted transposase YbfD/YdcC
MNDFMTHFRTIADPRVERCRQHALIDILFLAICAVLCGADGWEEIEDFGHARLTWLKRFFTFENGIPTHDTIARVLSRLAPDVLQSSFISWINSACELTHGEVIAIDGKTVRRSFKKGDRKSAIHMVSAWANENNLILGQQKVDTKSNEITAIPALLALLDIKGCIITIDAMGCQTAIAEKITAKGADYVLALKGNQSNLSDQVKHLFAQHTLPQLKQATHQEIDTGHGRNEKRVCRQIEINQKWLPESQRWPKLNTIIEISATREIGDKTTTEKRYYISSLPINAQQANSAVRQHWSIENKLHWVLDVIFREDESRIRRGNGAEVMSTLRRITLNLLKNNTTTKAGIKRKRKMAALDEDFLSALISGG